MVALSQPQFRIGSGYDVHRFIVAQNVDSCYIKICGVSIKHSMEIDAHSDGDVGIHAIVDAIFGAIGLGDIGEHFPPTSLEWKGIDSSHFLSFAVEQAKNKGYFISNADITIICEKPKIVPYKSEMKQRMSELLQISDDFVNIKATTTEKLGAIGRNEGIAAQAVVCMQCV